MTLKWNPDADSKQYRFSRHADTPSLLHCTNQFQINRVVINYDLRAKLVQNSRGVLRLPETNVGHGAILLHRLTGRKTG